MPTKSHNENVILHNIRMLRDLVPARGRRNAIILAALIFLGGILDVIGLASVVPVIMTALDDHFIETNPVMRALYSGLGFSNPDNFLIFLGLCLLFISLFKNVYLVFLSYLQSRYAYNIALDLARRQFRLYFAKDLLFFKETPSSRTVTDVVSIPIFFANGVILPMLSIGSEAVVTLIIILSILVLNPLLFLALILFLSPAFFIIYRSTRSRISKLGEEREKVLPRVHGEMYQSIHGVQDIKMYDKTQVFLERYLGEQFRLNETYRKAYIYSSIPRQAMEVFAVCGVLVIFFFALLTDSKNDLAFFISIFAAASFRMLPSMTRILSSLMSIKSNQYTTRILSALTRPTDSSGKAEAITFERELRFEQVGFIYPGTESSVLRNISFTIPKGECIGFIGESGSGKTTLLNILLRFLIEREGAIYADGQKLEPAHTRAWRDKIGYVKQDVFILDGSVKENIAFGVAPDKIDANRLSQALRMSSLSNFAESLPNGPDTNIGEMGGKLSGGQRQRIGIARAIYSGAEVFIFDEATSALDSQTENEVTESIRILKQEGKTIFIVAHRLSTLRHCDRILELVHGEIAGEYGYEEILGRGK